MNRKPPRSTQEVLRKEVGFGCPIEGCGNPYLEWHHFDPPWSEEQHHRPEGMIAICSLHHKKADGGAYTRSQLHAYKKNRAQAEKIRGKFDWLRNELLAIVGGNFYHETMRILTIDGHNVVWLRRDEEGYLRLNVQMLSLLPRERAIIQDNFWHNVGNPTDLKSPPQGKELEITYENGDHLYVKFQELASVEEASASHPSRALERANGIVYPVTSVEVNCRIGGTSIELRPDGTSIGSGIVRGCFASRSAGGIDLETGGRWLQNPSLLPHIPKSRNELCPCGSGERFKRCHGQLI